MTLAKSVPVTVDEPAVTTDATDNNTTALVGLAVSLFNAGKAGTPLEAAEQAIAQHANTAAGISADDLSLRVVERLRRGQ